MPKITLIICEKYRLKFLDKGPKNGIKKVKNSLEKASERILIGRIGERCTIG